MIQDTPPYETWGSKTVGPYNSNCALFILFDISDRASFDKVESLINECFVNIKNPNVLKYLVGTKSDLPHREVTEEECRDLAQQYEL